MKKHLHKILAGLLVCVSAVSMTACSSNKGNDIGDKGVSNQNIPMGRYIEESVELPKEMKSVRDWVVTGDSTVVLYGYDKDEKLIAYTLQEDNTWKSKDIEGINKLSRIDRIACGEDGTTYVLYTDEAYSPHIAKLVEGGMPEEINIEWGEISGYPMEMGVLSNGDILIGRQYIGVSRFDGTSGKLVAEYDGSEGEFAVTEDKLMQIDMQRGGVAIFDLETGDEIEFVAYDGLEWGSTLLSDENGSTYVVNRKGVSRLAPGGSMWENIIEGATSSFGMPSLYNKGVAMKNPEEVLVVFGDQTGSNEVIKYTYNADVPARPTTELSVYMLEENMTIRQAASEYQRQNPEVLINLQVGMGEGDSITKSDAIRTLNTELLAGKGPDLLILDGLPTQSYIDKGVLMDMGDFAGPAIQQGEWLENIMSHYEKDGEIYALPTRFKLPTMWGNPDIIASVNTLEELAEWAKAHPDKQVLYNMTPQQLIEKFYGTSAVSWLDEDGQIKEDEFMIFLESIKTLADLEAKDSVDEERYMMDNKSNEYLAYNDIELHVQTVAGMMQIMNPYSAIIQRGEGAFDLVISGEEGIFEPVGVIGINANGQNTDIAREIVKMAMSEQVQNVELGDGFAVNTKSFDVQTEKKEEGMMSLPMQVAGSRPIQLVDTDEKAFAQIANYGKSVKVPAMADEVLMQMIIEETKGYFDGEKTTKEAAAAVSQRTRAYLAE